MSTTNKPIPPLRVSNGKRRRGSRIDDEPLFQSTKSRKRNDGCNNSGHRYEHGSLSHSDYNVAWISALPIEMAAGRAMLDNIHESLPRRSNDTNTYILGSIGMHNIVIACLPSGRYGTNSAATVANNLRRSFPFIKVVLMVGIGGGVPGKVDIRLGDIVVGKKVVQYDFGKTVQGGQFQRIGSLNGPPETVMTAVAKLQADHESQPSIIPSILDAMLKKYPSMTKYSQPYTVQHQLLNSTHDHVYQLDNHEIRENPNLGTRTNQMRECPAIYYGNIASGNQVMKDDATRDRLAQELDILCFEMEAAGVMDNFSCLVIRGICDYCDSNKDKRWQHYAAATAAAYAKELLSVLPANFPAEKVRAGDHTPHSVQNTRGGDARGGDAWGWNAQGGDARGGNAQGGKSCGVGRRGWHP